MCSKKQKKLLNIIYLKTENHSRSTQNYIDKLKLVFIFLDFYSFCGSYEKNPLTRKF